MFIRPVLFGGGVSSGEVSLGGVKLLFGMAPRVVDMVRWATQEQITNIHRKLHFSIFSQS